MALVYFDRVQETFTTTGTGSLTLAGALNGTFRTFASVCSTSDTFYYCIEDAVNGAWETGLATYSGTNTLARTSVKASSNAGSAVNLGSGTKRVYMTPIAFMFTSGMTGFQPLDSDLTTIAANITAAGHAILDDANAAAQRATLGLYPVGVVTLTDGATPALDASQGNKFLLTAAGDREIAVPTNPTSGQKITIVHKASGADRTLSLNTGANGFRYGTDITGLTATTSGKTDYIGAEWNAADSKWDVIAYAKGF